MAALETSRAAEYHVATNGTGTGAGTLPSPLSLAKALSATSPAKAGDTIWLHGGIYQGPVTSYLKGTSINPIIVRQYPGEQATLNCTNQGVTVLDVEGSGTWYWGFEIENTDTNRVPVRGGGISVNPSFGGANNKFINLIIHDTGNGVFLSWIGTNTEVTGCLIYNNGYQGAEPDRGHGHGIYGQSKTDRKLLRDNIIFNQFGQGIQLYTSASYINNFNILGNTIFNNGSLTRDGEHNECIIVQSGNYSSTGNQITQNILYQSVSAYGLNAGNGSVNGDITIQSNIFAKCSVYLNSWTNATVLDNYFTRFIDWRTNQAGYLLYTWDRNHYLSVGDCVVSPNNFCLSWLNWRSAFPSFDAHGELLGVPTNSQVFIRINPYDSGRANITVLNWDLSDRVSINPSNVLSVGSTFEIRNAQNYFAAPVVSGVYSGAAISLPMTSLSVAKPVGVSSPPAGTGPQFNVFVLLAAPRISPPKNPKVAPAK